MPSSSAGIRIRSLCKDTLRHPDPSIALKLNICNADWFLLAVSRGVSITYCRHNSKHKHLNHSLTIFPSLNTYTLSLCLLCNETQAVKKSKHFIYFSNFQIEKYTFFSLQGDTRRLQGHEVCTRTHLCILIPAVTDTLLCIQAFEHKLMINN